MHKTTNQVAFVGICRLKSTLACIIIATIAINEAKDTPKRPGLLLSSRTMNETMNEDAHEKFPQKQVGVQTSL